MKTFSIQYGIGLCKYVVNVTDGKALNKDGSLFTGIRVFKNKLKMNKFIKGLKSEGYIEK